MSFSRLTLVWGMWRIIPVLREFRKFTWSSIQNRFLSAITTSIIIVEHLSLWYNSRQTFLLLAWKILSFMLKVSLLFMGYVTIIELLSWRIFILMNCRHPYRRNFSILYLQSQCCTCPFSSLSCGKVFMVLLCRLNKI